MIHPSKCLSYSKLGLGDKPGERPGDNHWTFSIQGQGFQIRVDEPISVNLSNFAYVWYICDVGVIFY